MSTTTTRSTRKRPSRPAAATKAGPASPARAAPRPALKSVPKPAPKPVLKPATKPATDAAPELTELGARVQQARTRRQMTLETLAERSGLSKGYLSRIENGLQTPPLGTLIRIAGALNADVTSLINGKAARSAAASPLVCVVRKAERSQVIRGASAFGYDYASLIAPNVNARMEAFLFTFPSNIDKYVFFEHEGEEFLFLLSGRVEWQIGHERHLLEPGDAVYFDARLPHRGRALEGEASALVVSHRPGS
jgi:transcriptional regulator with XRE-family HTH domain